MLYSGTIGMPFLPNISDNKDTNKVRDIFMKIAATNPYLSVYLTTEIAEEYMRSHQNQANLQHEDISEKSNMYFPSYVMPAHDVFPSASLVNIFDLSIGTDIRDTDIKYGHKGLMSILFPHLYTDGKKHYNLSDIEDIDSSNQIGTLKKYAKTLLLSADRRIAKDPNWFFFIFDLIEHKNIQSANRHVVSASKNFTREDVYNNNSFNYNNTSFVLHTIRSSNSYKKKHAYELHTTFNHMGPSQLFLTFFCDDFKPVYRRACNDLPPWVDAPMFARTFKDRWLHFLNRIIKVVSSIFLANNLNSINPNVI